MAEAERWRAWQAILKERPLVKRAQHRAEVRRGRSLGACALSLSLSLSG